VKLNDDKMKSKDGSLTGLELGPIHAISKV